MKDRDAESGFTLMELLVVMGIFAVVSVGMYQLVFSGTRGSDTTRSVIRISEEARLGLNRMIRDSREALDLRSASSTSFEIDIDFDADGFPGEQPPDSTGYERMRFSVSGDTILAGPTGTEEVLVRGIGCIDSDCGANPIFDYTSHRLEWDWNADGVTTWEEVDDATPLRGVLGVGDGDGILDPTELDALSGVVFNFSITDGDLTSEFDAHATMRNAR